MADAREVMLERMRTAARPDPITIERVPPPPLPPDPIDVFSSQLEAAGGSVEVLAAGSPFDSIGPAASLAEATHAYSTIEGIPSRGVGTDDEAPPRALSVLDVCVVEGAFAVVENGAIWQEPKTPLCRAAMLLAEHLIVFVPATALVASLHQAYDRIAASQHAGPGFGWFIAGPSKTADIEQALVLGAHGPRTMHVVLQSERPGP